MCLRNMSHRAMLRKHRQTQTLLNYSVYGLQCLSVCRLSVTSLCFVELAELRPIIMQSTLHDSYIGTLFFNTKDLSESPVGTLLTRTPNRPRLHEVHVAKNCDFQPITLRILETVVLRLRLVIFTDRHMAR